ncbi:MAG: hypothetical protein HFI76_12255 [Lachnospiraceae bacterium]|jgi:hypothetical protein|nr:hypothetical protein [Lachnospiraceae bacterium]
MGERKQSNTPYDDVFRTLLNDCSNLIIPVINEVFGETYTGEEKIRFSVNEHFLNQQDGDMQERITDTCFQIIGKESKKYHMECQSSSDHSMLIRFFEYDTQIALDDGEIRGNVLTVTFPHSAVLYLRSRESTPENLEVRMNTPGGSVAYDIPVMKVGIYTTKDLFEKNLLFLIPFYIFSHEERFERYEKDGKELRALKEEYAGIRSGLEKLQESGEISEYAKCTIIDMAGKVLEHIAKKYETVREGVRDVMGGRILEYEAKTIREEGRKEGREQGKEEGREQGREEGREEGIRGMVSVLKELGIPYHIIQEKIREQYHLSAEASEKYLL